MTRTRNQILGALFASALALMVGGCGDDDPVNTPPADDIENNLTFSRQDSSEVLMGDEYAICCGIWEPGFVDENTLKIVFFDTSQQKSGWKLFLLVDQVQVGETYSFPTDSKTPLKMFVLDVDDENELSSDDDASSGTVTVEFMQCGPPVSVRVTIDAVIGSEFHLAPPVTVSGSFRAVVSSVSSGCDFGI